VNRVPLRPEEGEKDEPISAALSVPYQLHLHLPWTIESAIASVRLVRRDVCGDIESRILQSQWIFTDSHVYQCGCYDTSYC
jgi:hypothetical protein